MKGYSYIFIIVALILCIWLICNSCLNVYDSFSVGGQEKIPFHTLPVKVINLTVNET